MRTWLHSGGCGLELNPSSTCDLLTLFARPKLQHYSYFNRYVLNPIQRDGYTGDGRRAMFRLKEDVLDKALLRRTKETRAADMELPPRIVQIKPVRLHPVRTKFLCEIAPPLLLQLNLSLCRSRKTSTRLFTHRPSPHSTTTLTAEHCLITTPTYLTSSSGCARVSITHTLLYTPKRTRRVGLVRRAVRRLLPMVQRSVTSVTNHRLTELCRRAAVLLIVDLA